MTKNNHEILICGAGMIGLTFALLIASLSSSVYFVNPPPVRRNVSGDTTIFCEGAVSGLGRYERGDALDGTHPYIFLRFCVVYFSLYDMVQNYFFSYNKNQ